MKLFTNLDKDAQAFLRRTAACRMLEKGEILYRHREPAIGMAVVVSGQLEAYRTVKGEHVTVAWLGADEVVGEMGLLAADHARTASVRAAERACILEFPDNPLDLFKSAGRPDIALQLGKNIVAMLADKLRRRTEAGLAPPPKGDAGIRHRNAWIPTVDFDAIEERLPRKGLFRKAVEVKHLRPGDVLVRQGEPARGFFFIHSGELDVTIRQPDGSEKRLDSRHGPTVIGELGYFSGQPRSATVAAKGDVEFTEFSGKDFEALAAANPEDALLVLYGAAQVILQLLYREDDIVPGM